MRLTIEDPEAPNYEVYYQPPTRSLEPWVVEAIEAVSPEMAASLWDKKTPAPQRLTNCVLADEEAGLVEFVLVGPSGPYDFGIGVGPVPEELPYGRLTNTATGVVQLRRKE